MLRPDPDLVNPLSTLDLTLLSTLDRALSTRARVPLSADVRIPLSTFDLTSALPPFPATTLPPLNLPTPTPTPVCTRARPAPTPISLVCAIASISSSRTITTPTSSSTTSIIVSIWPSFEGNPRPAALSTDVSDASRTCDGFCEGKIGLGPDDPLEDEGTEPAPTPPPSATTPGTCITPPNPNPKPTPGTPLDPVLPCPLGPGPIFAKPFELCTMLAGSINTGTGGRGPRPDVLVGELRLLPFALPPPAPIPAMESLRPCIPGRETEAEDELACS